MYTDEKVDSVIMSHKRIFTASKLGQELMRPDSGRGDADASLMENNEGASTEAVTKIKPLRKNDFSVLSEHRLSYVSRKKLFSEAFRISQGTGDLRVLIAHTQLVRHLETRHAVHMRMGGYCRSNSMSTFRAARRNDSMPFISEGYLINEEYREPSGYERAELYRGDDSEEADHASDEPGEADYDSDGSGEDEYDSDESGEDECDSDESEEENFDDDRGQNQVAGRGVRSIVARAKSLSDGIVVTERALENNDDDQNIDDTNAHPVTFESDNDTDLVPLDINDARARRIFENRDTRVASIR